MDKEERCETCKFWVEELEVCRRYPKVVLPKEDEYTYYDWGYPEAEPEDWCGEFKERG